MIRLFAKSSSGRKGNALLETAIVLPVLLSLAFGTVEFGYYFFVKNTVQGAAREGVRAGIVSTSAYSDITTAVTNTLSAAGINTSTTTVQRTSGSTTTTITSGNYSTITSGDSITVTVSVLWSNVGFSPLGIIASNKQVQGVAVMRRE